MKSKVSILIMAFVAAIVVNACRCPEVEYPYHDFASLEFSYQNSTNNDTVYVQNDTLSFWLNDAEITYVASTPSFSLIPMAYATQPCPTDGEFGRKYDVVSIEVYSDQDYDAAHPAGTLLNDFVLGNKYNSETFEQEFFQLNTLLQEDMNNLSHLKILKPENSNVNPTYTVKFIKSDSNGVEGETLPIIWQ